MSRRKGSNPPAPKGDKPLPPPNPPKKSSHPWRAFNPGWLKREPVSGLYQQSMHGITKRNRAC